MLLEFILSLADRTVSHQCHIQTSYTRYKLIVQPAGQPTVCLYTFNQLFSRLTYRWRRLQRSSTHKHCAKCAKRCAVQIAENVLKASWQTRSADLPVDSFVTPHTQSWKKYPRLLFYESHPVSKRCCTRSYRYLSRCQPHQPTTAKRRLIDATAAQGRSPTTFDRDDSRDTLNIAWRKHSRVDIVLNCFTMPRKRSRTVSDASIAEFPSWEFPVCWKPRLNVGETVHAYAYSVRDSRPGFWCSTSQRSVQRSALPDAMTGRLKCRTLTNVCSPRDVCSRK